MPCCDEKQHGIRVICIQKYDWKFKKNQIFAGNIKKMYTFLLNTLKECADKLNIIMRGTKVKNPIVLAQKGFFIWRPQNTSMQRNYAECEYF